MTTQSNRTFRPIFAILVAAAVLHGASTAIPAQNIDVGQALNKQLDQIQISSQKLVDVLADLGKRAGVPIEVDDRSIDVLPAGRDTNVANLTIQNATVREALTSLLGSLGLVIQEREDKIAVVPGKALERINRRAAWQELDLLRKCNETPFSIDAFRKLDIQYRITSRVNAPEMLAEQLSRAGRGTMAEMLEVATGSLGWTWFPEADHLVVLSIEAQINHRLSRRVSYKYRNEPLARILYDIANRANVALKLEPGMMLKLPESTAQGYTLFLEQASLKEALEIICAETGLKYEVNRDGLGMTLGEAVAGTTAATRRSGYVCKISVPSKDGSFAYEFLVREDELPADIMDYRNQIIEATIAKMRAEMAPDTSIKSGDGAQP